MVQVSVNGTNIGAGLIGLSLLVEVDGLGPDLVTLPLTALTPGGVLNPVRSPGEPVVQGPDRLRFTMVPGRGAGLSYRLLVRDLVRCVWGCACVHVRFVGCTPCADVRVCYCT
jgi:hypothetical protein